jgi:hypothetical protein
MGLRVHAVGAGAFVKFKAGAGESGKANALARVGGKPKEKILLLVSCSFISFTKITTIFSSRPL